MFWPGMGDPYKRKQTIKFLAITAAIGISVGVTSIFVQQWFNLDNPLKACIDDRGTPYKKVIWTSKSHYHSLFFWNKTKWEF